LREDESLTQRKLAEEQFYGGLRSFSQRPKERTMRKTLIAGTFIALLAAPTLASAQDAAAGAASGAAAGAIGGAIVGGPVGAAVGAGVGGTVGAAAADQNRRERVIVEEPSVQQRSCVQHADGTRVCETIRR
jgi:phage tail tape-measure protein